MHNRFVFYRQLLKLYPKTYREKYANQMLQTLGDMLDDQPNRSARTLVRLRAYRDLPLTIINQNALALGDNIMNPPNYIKRNSLLAVLLVAPFFAAIAASRLNRIINHHDLHNSWVWSTPVLVIWILLLPALAVFIGLTSYAVFVASPKSGKSPARRLFDIRRTWPLLVTSLLGLAIIFFLLFHDSAHCWLQGPAHTFKNFHQIDRTWQCTTSGFLGGR